MKNSGHSSFGMTTQNHIPCSHSLGYKVILKTMVHPQVFALLFRLIRPLGVEGVYRVRLIDDSPIYVFFLLYL